MPDDQLPLKALRAAHLLARIALAALFVAAALPKLAELDAFALSLDNYRVVPAALVGPLAVALPALELVVAAALLTRSHGRGAALLACVMLAAFAAGMAQAQLRGIDLDCGCFGTAASSPVTWWKVMANSCGAAVAAWVCFSSAGGWPVAPADATNAVEGST